MPLKGFDLFFTKPGEKTSVRCRVCRARCKVTRNAYGPTGYAMAVGKMAILHDKFVCPHADKLWHEQALALVCAIEEIGSPTLAWILRLDLARLVRRRKPTMPPPEEGWDPD